MRSEQGEEPQGDRQRYCHNDHDRHNEDIEHNYCDNDNQHEDR